MQYALTGNPLGHSVSPEIHRRLFMLENINASYEIFQLLPQQFEKHLPELFTLNGFNITLPYKQSIIPFLDELHQSASFYNSVNTVLRRQDGSHIGFNTDCDGFLHTLKYHKIPLTGKICVLGAGGVGRMFILECIRHGADVTVAVRNKSHTQYFQNAHVVSMDMLEGDFDLLINATPVGMYPNVNACPISEKLISHCKAVFDCIYNPTKTKLLYLAEKFNIPSIGGTDMLVWQAVAAHQYWNASSEIQTDSVNAMIPEIKAFITSHYDR